MFLSADGGGTKLHVLLADDTLAPVRSYRAGGVNGNFTPAQEIERAVREAADCVPAGARVERACVCMFGAARPFLELLRARGQLGEADMLGECEMGLLAGLGMREGFLALSGTGSDVFYQRDGHVRAVGGWGMMLGDEGSGGDIGQKGLIAAIHATDGRGPRTVLVELLARHWDITLENMGRLVARVYQSPSPRGVLASFAPIVSEAAHMGDAVALGIYERAGTDLAIAMNALMRRERADDPRATDLPVTLSGGAWKGHIRMFEAFCRGVHAEHPRADIRPPLFDATVGGLMHCALRAGWTRERALARLCETHADYRYQMPSPSQTQ